MTSITPAAHAPAETIPDIRKIGTADLNWALAEGWRDFREKRGDLILAGLLYPLICLVAVIVTYNDPLLPLFFPLVAGLSIAGPALRTSLAAARANPGAFAGWGLRVAALLALGLIPFAIGLAVVLPWLGYATWHLYTRIVVR